MVRRLPDLAWLILTGFLLLSSRPIRAQEEGRAERGRVLVQTRCEQCHAAGLTGASPVRAAPPLRDLHKRYPVAQLEEAFGEGGVPGHPAMPPIPLDPAQIADLIAYLKTFER